MPYTAHLYQVDRAFEHGTVNGGVSPTGTPGMRAYAVPLDGWDDVKAQDPHNLPGNVSSLYHGDADKFTRENYLIDQGPYMLTVQSVVPTEDTERPSGHTDPAAAGLARPDLRWESHYYRRGSGSDSTTFLSAPGVTRQPYGWQDGASWTQVQDTKLDLAEYGDLPLTPISIDPSVPQTMPDTMRALPPQPSGGWTSVPVNNIGQEVLLGWTNNASQSQQATAQEFTANSGQVGSTLLTRMRHVGQNQPPARVGGAPGGNWNKVG